MVSINSFVQLIPAILVVVDHYVVVRVVAVLAALLTSAALLSATTEVFPTRFGLSRRGQCLGVNCRGLGLNTVTMYLVGFWLVVTLDGINIALG